MAVIARSAPSEPAGPGGKVSGTRDLPWLPAQRGGVRPAVLPDQRTVAGTGLSGGGHQPHPTALARDIVKLKLRLTGNALRGSGRRVAMSVVGLLLGLLAAAGGFLGFAATAASDDPAIWLTVFGIGGAAVTLGWMLAPLLFFGVDETLDPARFALLPIPRRTLARGMLAAACVGIPGVVTFVAALGLVVFAAARGGPLPAIAALLADVAGLLLCVCGSRALTSGFARALRSRRGRDLAAVALALLAASVGPAQLLLTRLLRGGDLDAELRIARVLAWTPLAAAYTSVADAAAGDWGAVAAKLLITIGSSAALLWWWSGSLESAMCGGRSGPSRSLRPRGGAVLPDGLRGGAVLPDGPRAGAVLPDGPRASAMLPAGRWRGPDGPFGAVVAREIRYWWREPRRRAGMASLGCAGLAVPVALRVLPEVQVSLPAAASAAGVLTGMVLANQFGFDADAYATQLLAGLRGRVELAARAVAAALVLLVPLVGTTTVLALATGTVGQLAAAIGTLAAGLGASLGFATVVSVCLPHALPDGPNPFAADGGSAGSKGLLGLLGTAGAAAATGPVVMVGAHLGAVALPVGVCWGAGLVIVGCHLGGRLLDRRGPEVLAAVTPRR
jgi:ABC-2 type transport system permease protein